jgi:hydrogenase expression/formation protein HypD
VLNVFMSASHVVVPPAIEALLQSPDSRVQAFVAADHIRGMKG